MGGSEEMQAAWLRQHGTVMATCADNPSGAACQKAINERDAIGLAMALFPGSTQDMRGPGVSANASISYQTDSSIDPVNATIAGWVESAAILFVLHTFCYQLWMMKVSG